MSVIFANKEAIDLNVIRLMGVNVKVTETPIGFFGTGLKFAIATLLRNDQRVALVRDGHRHTFDVRAVEVRGEAVDIVTLDGDDLGFTTDLGRNWKVWEAYREFHSNTLDEGGVITDEPVRTDDFGTIFVVGGDEFQAAYDDRGAIFLDPERAPITHLCDVQIFAGDNTHGYYRGIRAIKHSAVSAFTYNVMSELELTEDRTVKYDFYFRHRIERAVSCLEDFDLLEQILTCSNDFEHTLDFSSHGNDVSETFLAVCGEHQKHDMLNASALQIWKTKQPARVIVDRVERLESEDDKLAQAFAYLKLMGCEWDMGNVVVVERLPTGRYAEVIDGVVAVEKSVFEMESFEIAKTIFPSVVCCEHDVDPMSCSYDEVVIDLLFGLTKRVKISVDKRRVFKPGGNY